jgi:hypothetical protein
MRQSELHFRAECRTLSHRGANKAHPVALHMFKEQAFEIHFSKFADEDRIARSFFECFNVTYGRKLQDISIWFLEPQNQVKQRFGIDKEIPVFFSRFPKVDARICNEIERADKRQDFRDRAERLLCFLVHQGSQADVENILQQYKERIVIAFNVEDLTSPTKGAHFVRKRLAEVLGQEDLFGMSSPLKNDTYFFGRDELVQTLSTRATIRNEHSGLFGLRKAGKTSVLYAVQRRAASSTTLAEYVDCQNPGVHNVRWWNALHSLSERIFAAAWETGRSRVTPGQPYTQDKAGSQFLMDIRRIIKDTPINKIVLLFDEIEWITPGLSGAMGAHWDKDFIPFWQTIRAVSQETQNALSFVVAGVNPTCVESVHFNNLPNPIFQLAVPHYLSSFDTRSARSMIRTIARYCGLTFSENVFAYLQSRFGGHPYLIRLACSEASRPVRENASLDVVPLTIETFERVDTEIRARIESPIKDILLSLAWWYPDDFDLLHILASDPAFYSEYKKNEPGDAQKFRAYGLLSKDGDFTIGPMRDFLALHGAEYKKTIGPFHRTEIDPAILPEVPDIHLLTRLLERKHKFETSLRRLLIVYLGVRVNWDEMKMVALIEPHVKPRQDRPRPKELFMGRLIKDVLYDLYTLDLAAILIGNWDLFSSLFDGNRARTEMNIETVNKARRYDSHILPISTDEIEEFDNSFHWLQTRIERAQLVL